MKKTCRLALLLSLLASPALSQPAKGGSLRDQLSGEVRVKYDRAFEAAKASDWSAARAEFLSAYELSKNPRILYNVAICERNLGLYPQAVARFDQELREGKGILSPAEEVEARRNADGLREYVGQLTLDVSEAGATVSVKYNGGGKETVEEIGKTPLPKPIELPSGQSTITVQKPGFLPFTKTLTVRGRQNERETIKLELASRYADVEVSVTGAPNAIVKIDNIERGPAPYRGKVEVRPEPHQFEASANGFLPATDSRVAVEGQKLSMTLALAKDTGRVRIDSMPAGTEIFIDGKPMGANHWEGPVAAGNHQLTVKKEGFYTRTIDVDVPAGGTIVRTASLDENKNTNWLGWAIGVTAIVGGSVAVSALIFRATDSTVPGTLRTVEQTPVPAAFRFR